MSAVEDQDVFLATSTRSHAGNSYAFANRASIDSGVTANTSDRAVVNGKVLTRDLDPAG
jgi:hypothetical protein